MSHIKTSKTILTLKNYFELMLLLAINAVIAYWVWSNYSIIWSWQAVHLANQSEFNREEFIAFSQLLFFGITINRILQILAKYINRKNQSIYIPKILTQVLSILIYGLIALFGAVKLYDLPIRSLLAASGVVSIILAYAFRELISDILASMQIQMNRIARLGDWICIKHNEEMVIAKVIDLDQQIVTLQDSSHVTRLIRNSLFLQQSIINYNAHGNTLVRHAELEINSRFPHTEIIPVLENALAFVQYQHKEFHGHHHVHIKSLAQGNINITLDYCCHPSISKADSQHLVLGAAIRFLKCAGFDLTPAHSIISGPSEAPPKVPHRLLQAKEFGVLQSLNLEETQTLQDKLTWITLAQNEVLLTQGDQKEAIYIVSEGQLRIEIPKEVPQDHHEKWIEVGKCWPGDVVGEMSLLTGAAHTANVTACTPCVVMVINKTDIKPLLQKSPILTQAIVDHVIKLKQINEKAQHHQPNSEERKNLLGKVFQFLGIS
jgi:CRP-like cAMP-binding protein/small-conductance mechanosensitive channel